MSDLTLTYSGEWMITEAQGNTEAGVDFIDAWPYPATPDEMYVHDAGQIFVHAAQAVQLETAALAAGLTVAHCILEDEL